VTKMYCDDSDCRRGMKVGAGVGAHKTNNATKVNPEIQRGMVVKRGRMPPKWELRVCWPLYLSQIYLNVNKYGGPYELQRRSKPRSPGGKPPQSGNLCVTVTVFVAQQQNLPEHFGPEYHPCCTMFSNSGRFSPFGGINPQKTGNDWPCRTRIITKCL